MKEIFLRIAKLVLFIYFMICTAFGFTLSFVSILTVYTSNHWRMNLGWSFFYISGPCFIILAIGFFLAYRWFNTKKGKLLGIITLIFSIFLTLVFFFMNQFFFPIVWSIKVLIDLFLIIELYKAKK